MFVLKVVFKFEECIVLEQGFICFFVYKLELLFGVVVFGGVLKKNCMLFEWMVEFVCLRVVFYNQCCSCMVIRYIDVINDGFIEDLVCSLEKLYEVVGFIDVERVVICFGELFVINYFVIDDVFFDQLKVYFIEFEIMELVMIVVFFVGFGCFGVVFYMVEELLSAFQGSIDDGFVVFWYNEVIQVC